jgi:hypothetical protein
MGVIDKRASRLTCGFVALFGMALAACSSSSNKAVTDPNILPTNYRDEVLRIYPKIVSDPTNTRDASISDPVFEPNGPVKVYYVCVRANPRDVMTHAYLGIKQYVGYFYDGYLTQFVIAPAGLCDKAAYKPFPELEKLCLGKTCH